MNTATTSLDSLPGSGRLRLERDGHVLIATLDDPSTRNALYGNDLFSDFEALVTSANADLSVRAVILTGAGSAFSSGGNIREMHDKTGMFGGAPHEIAQNYKDGIQRIPRALMAMDVPLIAAVNGPAIGAGCDLACMCDVRIASTRATFAESFVRVGIVAGDGGSWLLPRLIGYARAAEMAFTGEAIDAKQGFSIGLVSKVVPHEKLMESALDLAGRIAANPPHVLRWSKRLLREAQHERLDTILDMAASYQALAHQTSDHAEAVAALLEKRTPGFTGH
jgi:2-(1,2-epoxy-1,2-dihydrophenyl)acetyl-CoA isomerase